MKPIAVTICLLVLSFADLALAQQPAPVGPGASGPAPLVEKPLRFGGRLGFNFARVSSDPDIGDQLENRVGIAIGGFASFAFGPNIAIEPGIAYSQRGFGIDLSEFGGGSGTVALDYLDLPVIAVGRFPVGPTVRLRGFGGAALGVNVGASTQANGQSEDLDDVAPIDLGLIVGAGADISMGTVLLIFDLRFEIGLVNVVDDDTEDEAFNRVVSINGGFAL